ncbi:hypothetical protein EDD11_009298 [Mortierella claussenii]|nr:hypothetical protein EDD11_009298 [Mortierella claussenii]
MARPRRQPTPSLGETNRIPPSHIKPSTFQIKEAVAQKPRMVPTMTKRTRVKVVVPEKGPQLNQDILDMLNTKMNVCATSNDPKIRLAGRMYEMAIAAIQEQCQNTKIMSEQMAVNVPRLCRKVAREIGEFLAHTSGPMDDWKAIDWDKREQDVKRSFEGVLGVGSEKAQEWFRMGFRTMEEIKSQQEEDEDILDLTSQQKFGLKFYEELNRPIPQTMLDTFKSLVDMSAKTQFEDIEVRFGRSHRWAVLTTDGADRHDTLPCEVDLVLARPLV